MVHPVFGICFAICAGSIQTAISRFVAAGTQKGKTVFQTGLVISFSMSLALSAAVCRFAPFLAGHLLLEPRCAPLLPIMALAVPCTAVHACVNGYYYGLQKTKVPAGTQLAEQMIRIAAVFLIADIMTEQGHPITVRLAVYGHLIGEAAATLFSMLAFAFPPEPQRQEETSARRLPFLQAFRETAPGLMTLAMPLMGNRLVLNLLSSAEAVLIPNRLLAFGLLRRSLQRVRRAHRHGHAFHSLPPPSLTPWLCSCCPSRGRSPVPGKTGPDFLRRNHVPALQPLHGHLLHRDLHQIWK